MQLTFDARVFSGEKKTPIPARPAVIAPVRYRGIVPEDGIESDLSLVLVAEILHPREHFFLSRRVPWHFAATGTGLRLPMVCAGAHLGLQVFGLCVEAFAFQVLQD